MSYQSLGRVSMAEAITSGADLGALLSRQLADRHNHATAGLLLGGVESLIDSVAMLRKGGARFVGLSAAMNEFLRQPAAMMLSEMYERLSAAPDAALTERLEALAGTVVGAYRAGALSFKVTPKSADNTVQAIRIVEMPTRQTTTEVSRDTKGNITEAVQVEADRIGGGA